MIKIILIEKKVKDRCHYLEENLEELLIGNAI